MFCLVVGLSTATIYVGDEVTFSTNINPYETCQLECDLDMSDDYGVWLYGGYALKDPQGNIVSQQNPILSCDGECKEVYQGNNPACLTITNKQDCINYGDCYWESSTYNPSLNYVVDEPGTWKFCAVTYGLEVSYANQQCSGGLIDCEMVSCQDVVVESCDETQFETGVLDSFLQWLDTW